MKLKNDHRSKFPNLTNWKEEAWKKSGLQRDSNPWPPRYRWVALPTELWSHTLGARSIYWVHISESARGTMGMPHMLSFSFSPASPQHKEASTEERVITWMFNTKLGCAPLGWSGSGSVIGDHSDRGRSNEPMNPLGTTIRRFIKSIMIPVMSSLILIRIIPKERTLSVTFHIR